jgi:hypothetical protein
VLHTDTHDRNINKSTKRFVTFTIVHADISISYYRYRTDKIVYYRF